MKIPVVILLVLILQSLTLHAELLFQSSEQINGKQSWSALKKYSNPSDIVSTSKTEIVRVFLSGEISRADVTSAEILDKLIQRGKQKIYNNTIWFSSNGGDIDSGMDLGRLFRKWEVFTYVSKNDQCHSACVFAFMGGERRKVEGQLGIHRPYYSFMNDNPDRRARYRNLQKVLKDYIEEMDFPASLYEAVMIVPPESIYFLTPADLKKFYLEGMSPSSEDAADGAGAKRLNLSMFEYLQLKAKAYPYTVDP